MVLRCYDHNLNTDRKRRLWIWSGLFSVAFYENAAVSILRTAITLTRPTLHLCHKQSRLYFPLAFRTRPRWSLGFVQGIAAGAWIESIACHNNTHNCDVCFFRFPNENYGDRYVLIVSSMKLMYHKGWRTNVLSQILSVTHPPAVGLRSRCRPLTSVSFNYAPSLPPFMLPFRIIFDIYIIKLRMWRDGSRLAAVCLGRWKFVGPRRSSLHSVRFGQLLVTLCTSTHCQCDESVHRKELLLFIPFMTV